MKKQDVLTPIGLILAFGLVIFAAATGKDGLGIFFDLMSVIIVIFGSFAAVLITFSMDDMKEIPKGLKYAMSVTSVSKIEFIETLKSLSKKARRDGLLSIEYDVEQIDDPFLKKGLELTIDGVEANMIREILEIEISTIELANAKNAKIFKVWGSYAPAFGMIGTLVGLIQMLADLGTPDNIASGMGKALITTFYGALLSNAILNPLGFNIDTKNAKDIALKEMMLEGILSLQSGESSTVIEEKLTSYLSDGEKNQYYTMINENPQGEAGNVA